MRRLNVTCLQRSRDRGNLSPRFCEKFLRAFLIVADLHSVTARPREESVWGGEVCYEDNCMYAYIEPEGCPFNREYYCSASSARSLLLLLCMLPHSRLPSHGRILAGKFQPPHLHVMEGSWPIAACRWPSASLLPHGSYDTTGTSALSTSKRSMRQSFTTNTC